MSLKVEPAYLPALIDTAIAHFYEHDERKAEIALRAVDKVCLAHVNFSMAGKRLSLPE